MGEAESDELANDLLDDDEPPEPAGLRAAVVARLGGEESTAFIEVCPVEVPGLVVFAAHQGRRSTAGLWDGVAIDLDPDAGIQRVTEAWAYGPGRTVAARDVAYAIGVLEGHPGSPFLDQAAIDLGGDVRMRPPREVEVDGAPAVEFWSKSGRLSPYRASYVVVDGRAEVRRG
jgi:hypothetical protein